MEFKFEGKSLKSGVYKIVNKLNGRTYYGSAKEFKRRSKQHVKALEAGKHYNKFLQADFNACGTDAFIFEVIEVVEGDKNDRLLVEQRYLDIYQGSRDNCYNLRKEANATDGCWSKNPEITKKKHSLASKKMWESEEHRKNISEKNSEASKKQWSDPEIREKMIKKIREVGERMKGVPRAKHSEETKRKIAIAHTGLSSPHKGKKLSEEHAEKSRKCLLQYAKSEKRIEALRSAARIKRGKPIIAWNISEPDKKIEFLAIRQAAKEIFVNPVSIRKILRGHMKMTKAGWIFSYKE
jgi:group I intron endonuclease